MAISIKQYSDLVRQSLGVALCLRDFPSERVEKHNKPEIEMFTIDQKCKNLVNNPICFARSEKEKVLIEPSINSCRVSLSFRYQDDIDQLILEKFSKFFAVRADLFDILRREAIPGYHLSFLITNENLQKYEKHKIIDFIIDLLESTDKNISEMKLNIITQTRIAANFFVNALANK